jgi:NitT/TauT family transport system substrate-binding protein
VRLGRSRIIAMIMATVACAALNGCGGSDDKPGTSLDHVTYLTAFGAAGRDAFVWVAEEKGYLRSAGIDVRIQLGKATGENLKALSSGQAQFANLDLTGAMITAFARQNSGFKDVRAVLGVHQHTLVSIMSEEGSGITSPKNLEGKTIAAAANSVNQLLFPGYAKLAGVDASKVKWVAVQPVQLGNSLASGKVDALSTFLIGRPTIEKATLQAHKKKVVVLPYSEYLPDLFGNAVIAPADLIKSKPDLVERFRGAMLKALEYTIAHPDEAGALLHAKQPATAADAATGEIKLMTPSVTATDSGSAIGVIDRARMARAIAGLQKLGLIRPGVTPEDVVDFDVM